MTPEQKRTLERFFEISGAPGPHTKANAFRQAQRLIERHELRQLPPWLAGSILRELEDSWRESDIHSFGAYFRNERLRKRQKRAIEAALEVTGTRKKRGELADDMERYIRQRLSQFQLERVPPRPKLMKALRKREQNSRSNSG